MPVGTFALNIIVIMIILMDVVPREKLPANKMAQGERIKRREISKRCAIKMVRGFLFRPVEPQHAKVKCVCAYSADHIRI